MEFRHTIGVKMKHIIFLYSLFTISLAFSADNSIYIDQIGSSSTIDLKQDGGGNKIYGVGDTEGTAATFTGSSQTVDIQQIGGSNLLGIDLNTTVASGVGIDLTYYITGSNSVASIDVNGDGLGVAANNTADIQMTGDYNDLVFDLLGTGNSLTATATGGSYNDFNFTINADTTTVGVAISGGGANLATLNLSSDNAILDIDVIGASNNVGVTQSGIGGVGGMFFDLDINGSSNVVTTTQTDVGDHTMNIGIVGSSNLVTATQNGSTGTAGHNIELDITGGSNTVSSSQTGAQDNDANINITGSSNTWSLIQSD